MGLRAWGFIIYLSLKHANAGIQLIRHRYTLVIREKTAHESGIVRADLRHVAIQSIAEFRVAVALRIDGWRQHSEKEEAEAHHGD